MEVRLVNLTPHDVVVGGEAIPPSGVVARVDMRTKIHPGEKLNYNGIVLVENEVAGVVGLPDPDPETRYIVSGIVLGYVKNELHRFDCCAPDTGPTAVRDEKGQIVAVTRLVI
jgi:hypothetical protein